MHNVLILPRTFILTNVIIRNNIIRFLKILKLRCMHLFVFHQNLTDFIWHCQIQI